MLARFNIIKSIRTGLEKVVVGVMCGALWSSAVCANEFVNAGRSQSEAAGIPTFQVFLQISTVLALIIVLIFGATWLLKRIGRFNRSADGLLSVVSVLPLGSRERIVLLQAGPRQLLLGVAPGRVSTLHIFDEAVEPGIGDRSGEPRPRSFASLVSRLQALRSHAERMPDANTG
ncbi:MAG: flagellar biosynthetic protein FliO [Gammaproteobacteria bacterium]|nr:flagellar biosynthetic protein FliO [Gammaproteobacteria bacterium]